MTRILSILIYAIVRLVSLTYRFRYTGLENLEKAKSLSPSNGYLLGVWHQNLFSGILSQTGLHYVVIVSRNKDAEAVAFTCKRFGHKVVRGSSRKGNVDKGGKAAKEEMIEVLRTGIPGAVTVDGPKGPAKEVKAGIIDMAKKSGTALVAYSTYPEKFWSFNSWDEFRFPKPFSRIVVNYGEPLIVPEDVSKEEFDSMAKSFKSSIDAAGIGARSALLEWKTLSKSNLNP